MYPLIIQTIATDQVRERTERAQQRARIRQARAAARQGGGRTPRRMSVTVFGLRPAAFSRPR